MSFLSLLHRPRPPTSLDSSTSFSERWGTAQTWIHHVWLYCDVSLAGSTHFTLFHCFLSLNTKLEGCEVSSRCCSALYRCVSTSAQKDIGNDFRPVTAAAHPPGKVKSSSDVSVDLAGNSEGHEPEPVWLLWVVEAEDDFECSTRPREPWCLALNTSCQLLDTVVERWWFGPRALIKSAIRALCWYIYPAAAAGPEKTDGENIYKTTKKTEDYSVKCSKHFLFLYLLCSFFFSFNFVFIL